MGTDWPVSGLDPWIGFEAMITRMDPTGQNAGSFYGKGLELQEAIRVMTLNGAWCMGIDDIAGSIEAGKSADLIVLDRDLFKLQAGAGLHQSQVLLTLIEGQVTWDAASILGSVGRKPVWSAPLPCL